MDNFHDNLEKLGGTRDVTKYFVVLAVETTNIERWNKFYEDFPEYKGVQILCLNKETCLCSKAGLKNLKYIQLIGDKSSPLILVGSCCIKKFIPKDENEKSYLRCITCRKPYKHNITGQECAECRTKRNFIFCEPCGKWYKKDLPECDKCVWRRENIRNCTVCEKEVKRKEWEQRNELCKQCEWFPLCVKCKDERPKRAKWEKYNRMCWTCLIGTLFRRIHDPF